MPNLVVTRACSLGCRFCFAPGGPLAEGADAPHELSPRALAEQIATGGLQEVRLCGGEPTEHPRFVELLEVALVEPERRVFLMTNGLWPEPVRAGVGALDRRQAERVEYLVNVLPPEHYREDQRQALAATLERLSGRRLGLGVTIDRQPAEVAHVLDLARLHRARQLRFSIAAPSLVDPRTWRLDPARDFGPLAGQVTALAREARALGLRVQSDCGYLPPCAFDDAARATLLDGARPGEIEWTCHGPVDVDAAGRAWRCYGLAPLVQGRLAHHANLHDLSEHLEEQVRELAAPWLYEACPDCRWRHDGSCGGGCHALRLVSALQRRAARVGVDAACDPSLLAAPVRVDDTRLRAWTRRGQEGWMLRQSDTWSELAASALDAAILRGASRGAVTVQALGIQAPAPELARTLRLLLIRGALSFAA